MDSLKDINDKLTTIENFLVGQKSVLNIEEVAIYTGFSKSYLYKLTSSNAIPHYKPNGKQIFIEKKSLDSWLLRNRVKTVEEVEKEAVDHLTNKKRSA